jgi:hypothetical protein
MASGLILAQIAALKDLADASASADASAKTSLCADAPAPYGEPRAAYGAPPYGVVAPALTAHHEPLMAHPPLTAHHQLLMAHQPPTALPHQPLMVGRAMATAEATGTL